MENIWVILFVMQMRISSLALLAVMAWAAAVGASPDEIQWLDNYKDAIKEAKQTGKPIFLEFRCEA